ncbi:Cytidylate kinase [hydrothermal vent metagenome]|uniref:(d)CMP kinase n=1 Tax=hydrothermal vent metagenome TaxID=652676 RepID=A0A3B1AIB4_9ZZZZ
MSNIIITIDGPSGAGKGTVCVKLAKCLNWPLLDSGAIYRVLAWGALKHNIDYSDIDSLCDYATTIDISFPLEDDSDLVDVILEGHNISNDIRTEKCGNLASKVAVIPQVRDVLLQRQRDFAKSPGLVADGRDLGTVVFPQAQLKIYLLASAQVRAERRYKQLKDKGNNVNLASLLDGISERDKRDSERAVSPLKPADDAIIIDTSSLDVEQVLQEVKQLCCDKLQLLC